MHIYDEQIHVIYIQANRDAMQKLGPVPNAELFIQDRVTLQKPELILERMELKLNKKLEEICQKMVKNVNYEFLKSMYQMDQNFVFPTKKIQLLLMKIAKLEDFVVPAQPEPQSEKAKLDTPIKPIESSTSTKTVAKKELMGDKALIKPRFVQVNGRPKQKYESKYKATRENKIFIYSTQLLL